MYLRRRGRQPGWACNRGWMCEQEGRAANSRQWLSQLILAMVGAGSVGRDLIKARIRSFFAHSCSFYSSGSCVAPPYCSLPHSCTYWLSSCPSSLPALPHRLATMHSRLSILHLIFNLTSLPLSTAPQPAYYCSVLCSSSLLRWQVSAGVVPWVLIWFQCRYWANISSLPWSVQMLDYFRYWLDYCSSRCSSLSECLCVVSFRACSKPALISNSCKGWLEMMVLRNLRMWQSSDGSTSRRNYMQELILFRALLMSSWSRGSRLVMHCPISTYRHVHSPMQLFVLNRSISRLFRNSFVAVRQSFYFKNSEASRSMEMGLSLSSWMHLRKAEILSRVSCTAIPQTMQNTVLVGNSCSRGITLSTLILLRLLSGSWFCRMYLSTQQSSRHYLTMILYQFFICSSLLQNPSESTLATSSLKNLRYYSMVVMLRSMPSFLSCKQHRIQNWYLDLQQLSEGRVMRVSNWAREVVNLPMYSSTASQDQNFISQSSRITETSKSRAWIQDWQATMSQWSGLACWQQRRAPFRDYSASLQARTQKSMVAYYFSAATTCTRLASLACSPSPCTRQCATARWLQADLLRPSSFSTSPSCVSSLICFRCNYEVKKREEAIGNTLQM